MKQTLKRLAISATATSALATGLVAAGVASAPEASAVPCGLTYHVGDVPLGPLKVVYYDIRNCHSYTVKRKLDLAGTTDGYCHKIRAGKTVRGTRIISGWAAVRGLKAC